MRWRSTIAAALVFAALLAWVLTQEKGRVPQEGEVFGIDIAQVKSLRVERKDEKPLALERQGEDWIITEPIRGLADTDEVERMIKAVAELKPISSRENVNLDAEEFGLADRDLVVTLTCTDGKEVQLIIGDETPLGSERYARITGGRGRGADDKLYVVSAYLRTTLWKKPSSLREKKVARIETDDVRQLILDHGDEHIVAVRNTGEEDDGVLWRLAAPLEVAADEWSTKQVINNLRDLRAEDFLDEEMSDEELGFDAPQAQVTLKMADGRELTITFGKTVEREVGDPPSSKEVVYTRTSERDEIMLVKADVLDKVRKTAFDLRDKSVLRFERADVERISVERKKGLSFTVARRPDGWRVERPQSFDARQSAIDDILWDLEDLSAVKFVTEAADKAKLRECGLAVPQTVITIYLRGREPIKVLIGNETEEGNYYCTTSENERIVEISKFLMGDLPEDINDLKKSTTEDVDNEE